jgi:hypothetical protein
MHHNTMKHNSAHLCQTWIYTQEESSRDVMVYYAEGYPLPPARGREQMTFEPTGKFIKWVIAPACGFEAIPGTWQWQPNGHILIQLSESLKDLELVILDLTAPKLCIAGAPALLYAL